MQQPNFGELGKATGDKDRTAGGAQAEQLLAIREQAMHDMSHGSQGELPPSENVPYGHGKQVPAGVSAAFALQLLQTLVPSSALLAQSAEGWTAIAASVIEAKRNTMHTWWYDKVGMVW